MGECERHLREPTTVVSESGSHTLSRRSLFSFFSLAAVVGFVMDIAKGQTANEHERESRSVEVVHTRVFAAGPNGGNPCPVVSSADHLDVRAMQALSKKFGLDTVFLLTPQSKDADIRLRYFVPQHEMGVQDTPPWRQLRSHCVMEN